MCRTMLACHSLQQPPTNKTTLAIRSMNKPNINLQPSPCRVSNQLKDIRLGTRPYIFKIHHVENKGKEETVNDAVEPSEKRANPRKNNANVLNYKV